MEEMSGWLCYGACGRGEDVGEDSSSVLTSFSPSSFLFFFSPSPGSPVNPRLPGGAVRPAVHLSGGQTAERSALLLQAGGGNEEEEVPLGAQHQKTGQQRWGSWCDESSAAVSAVSTTRFWLILLWRKEEEEENCIFKLFLWPSVTRGWSEEFYMLAN